MNEEKYSEEAQEVMSYVPKWIIRWGNLVIFTILCIVIVLAYLIQYPDIIAGKFILTTEVPPVKLTTISSGKIISIAAKDGAFVQENSKLAEIENPITESGVLYLEDFIKRADRLIKNSAVVIPETDSLLVFGEIQPQYTDLKKYCEDYKALITDDNYTEQVSYLRKKIAQFRGLITVAKRQAEIYKNELSNADAKLAMDKRLLKEGVTSQMDFYREESIYNQKKINFENQQAATIQTQVTLTDLEKQLYDLEYGFNEKKRIYHDNILLKIGEIRNGIKNWKRNYILTAPIAGKVVILKHLYLNQFINSGEVLFAIVPSAESYVGIMTFPAKGFGKIRLNQKVRIKFDNYPYYQFGVVSGKVKQITEISNQDFYRVEVELANGLKSSYKKELAFTPEMSGVAEIITEDLRLTDRLFYQFRTLLERDEYRVPDGN